MVYRKIVFFDRPLEAVRRNHANAVIPEDEVKQQVEEAFRQGAAQERRVAEQEIAAARAEVAALGEGTLSKIAHVEAAVTQQVQQALPALAHEIAQRLLAGFQPPADVVERLCREALEQLYPERDGLELSVCPRDLELLQSLKPDWTQRFGEIGRAHV